jgi:DNA-binding Xre family transcriptional regulator
MKLNRYRVMELMDNAGYKSQTELAEDLGVASNTVSVWLRGGGVPLARLGGLCRLLNCTPNDILVLDAPKTNAPASLTLEPA